MASYILLLTAHPPIHSGYNWMNSTHTLPPYSYMESSQQSKLLYNGKNEIRAYYIIQINNFDHTLSMVSTMASELVLTILKHVEDQRTIYHLVEKSLK